MPEVSIEISVSRREADRPRLLQLAAFDDRGGLAGVAVQLSVDEGGTFFDDPDSPTRARELVTGSHGLAFFQWFEWPRNGAARDYTSVITAVCREPNVVLYLEDLHE